MIWTLDYKCGVITCGFQLTLLLFNFGSLVAVTVTSLGDSTLQLATGDSIQLNCTYTLASTDVGSLDIEWAIIKPDSREKDIVVLAFMENQVYQYLPPALVGRFKFVASDPSGGDASALLSNIQESDIGIYQCKVKKTPGIDSRKITLAVFVRPSKPTCRIEDTQDGKGVILQCKAEGTTPITYTWQVAGGQNTALPASAVQDPVTGDMTITNSTDANSGTYRCIAKNVVGQTECVVMLTPDHGKSRVGMIVGAIIGALLLLLLLLLLLWLLICCCNKRRYQKEVANEIREDIAPPVSHASSRASSLRSILGYRTHHVNYSLRRQYKATNQSDLNSPVSSIYASSREGAQQPPKNVGVTFAPLPSSQVNTSRAASNASSIPASRVEGYKRDRTGGYSLRETERPGWGDINRVPSNASAPPGDYMATKRKDIPFTAPVRSSAMEDISRIPSNVSDLRFGKIADNNISRMGGVPVMIPAQAREGYAV